MNNNSFYIHTLGCAKNSVDSSGMAQILRGLGYKEVTSASRARFIIVNTCGFIETARQESYETLAELTASRKKGQFIIAAGCLAQRYGLEIAETVPGIDGIIGTRTWVDIGELIQQIDAGDMPRPLCHLPDTGKITSREGVRQIAVEGASAWLKIADGCRHRCAFCAIPLIKGPAVSRPREAILDDARWLQQQGVKEIILIAQDTTAYGADTGQRNGLAGLLRDIASAVPQIDWLRVMYAYPGGITEELIDTMANLPQVVPYIDLPLQHANPDILRRMGRPSDIDDVQKTLERIREVLPGVALRTTFIVGYPGETEKEFQDLLDFTAGTKFDRLGAFMYSFEKGTPAELLGDTVAPVIKEERLQRLMELQQSISLENNRAFIGRTLNVLIEGKDKDISVGRSYRDAPEIDGLVIVAGEMETGAIAPVKITGASVHDLVGRPVDKLV